MIALSLLKRNPEAVAATLARRGWPQERVNALLAATRDAPDDAALTTIARMVPNPPDERVPAERAIRREWGEPARESWRIPHWELAIRLGMMDQARGAAITGPRFTLLSGWGARLERALTSFMLDLHATRHGYHEIAPPIVISGRSLGRTGHLPHFRGEMYAIAARAGDSDEDDRSLWLNPTAEVPLVAMHAGLLAPERTLPLKVVAGLASFRREVGSPGRMTRGLLRLHQFTKVELAQIAAPNQSDAAFDALTVHAEAVLEALGLPYRTVDLPARELSFAARRGRDIEVWLPGIGAWVEISSISDCGTFQSRRAEIRVKPAGGGRPRLAHTLNASGLAVGRTLAALIEVWQDEASALRIPPALRSYVGGVEAVTSTNL